MFPKLDRHWGMRLLQHIDRYMSSEKSSRLQEIERARKHLGSLVQAYERDFGINSYLNRAPRVAQKKLDFSRMLVDRYELLRQLPQNSLGVEVGVDKGDFSRHILDSVDPVHLCLIDIDFSRLSVANEKILRNESRVELIEGDSALCLTKLASRACDWIYVDAHHGYEYVSKDIQAAHDKIKLGGYLVFNDYTLWSPANMMNYGVSRAVNEFLNQTEDWTVAFFALSGGGYHDIALRRVT